LHNNWNILYPDNDFLPALLISARNYDPHYIVSSVDALELNNWQRSIYNSPINALVCIKTLIQMSHTKTLKITPTCFDHQMIIIRELFDPD
jgi:hypothetical protein